MILSRDPVHIRTIQQVPNTNSNLMLSSSEFVWRAWIVETLDKIYYYIHIKDVYHSILAGIMILNFLSIY